jgi:hypothetical protein
MNIWKHKVAAVLNFMKATWIELSDEQPQI